ncbi:2'-5' RNA ligase [Deinococcus irradiatisoli]|uniref:2'-5' RNA ligase n=1 Tax=Deinococcus irradiatisoli TaxID=2202254 RepID=A0A2Z3JDU8_9DEIO|nr:2'-5' RNA ligase family protein [Deinococcus irradiatisoli]AWN23353.1 2'-5' RNA ligase [Deinococcus irradiatisoli]
MTLYSVVAWPTAELGAWLRELQRRLGVSSYGDPHLNLRVPFDYAGDPKTLICEVRKILESQPPFQVEFLRWRHFPHVFFMEYTLSPALEEVHRRLIKVPGAPAGRYDGEHFIPHLSLAIGVCDWAEDALWRELEHLRPPQVRFEVRAASLTREGGGELQEIHTFPLGTRLPLEAQP